MGSTLKPGGIRAVCDDFKSVFVMGAYGLGSVLTNYEVVTAGFTPGMFVDPIATVGLEEQVTIGATGSVVTFGVAEVDFGVVASCAVAYALTDSVPIIAIHWNPGALMRNLNTVDPGADVDAQAFYGTTSGTAGKFKADITSGAILRGQDFVVNGASADIVGWFESFAP